MKVPLSPFLLLIILMCNACTVSDDPNPIRINQLGYYPQSPKIAVIADLHKREFEIIDHEGNTVLNGELQPERFWHASGEKLQLADFSKLSTPGSYRLKVGETLSYPFEISSNIYEDAAEAALKSYYFHRSGIDLKPEYAGPFARKRDSMYDKVVYHASTGKPETLSASSIGGWYDAGDYGKYIVNAAVSVSTMLQLYECLPSIFPDNTLNIPESGNGISDLLDELKFEIDWMLKMQDEDGGVFHKVTALGFEGMVMPDKVDDQRYIIGKSTNASVTFAGTLAKAARSFSSVDEAYAKKLLIAAEKAWEWANMHPDALYAKNPEGVRTGSYNSDQLQGEFFWAAVELLTTTQDAVYHVFIEEHPVHLRHQLEESWRTYYPYLAYYTLSTHPKLVSSLQASEQLLSQANQQLEVLNTNPYLISIDHFVWGSNSDILNQAVLFQMAHFISGERKFLDASYHMVDYIFGKNAVGFSFLTGFGDKPAIRPHHRLAESDSVEGPIPGFIIGGPNVDRQDSFALAARGKKYSSDFPAKCYLDELASFASNEVCINWNAPAVFALGYLQANKALLD